MAPELSANQSSSRLVRLNTSDYECIVTWLEDKNNYNGLFGAGKRQRLDGMIVTKSKMLATLANHVNENSHGRLSLTDSLMYHRIRRFKGLYERAKQTGAEISEQDKKRGINTISQKLDSICPFFERMDVLFGDKPDMNPRAIVDTSRRNEIRESATVLGAVAESGYGSESGEGTEEKSESEELEEEELEEEGAVEETILLSDTVPQPTVLQSRHRWQHSVDLEEGLDNRRTLPKRRRTDGNAAADLADDGAKRKIACEKEKLELMEESADHARRLDHENAKELTALGGEVKKGLMVKEAQLKLLDSLFANKATEEEIDWHMRIFQKYNG